MEKRQLFEIARQNSKWLQRNYEDLKRTYDNHWVVIHNEKVVGSSSTFNEIMKIAKRYAPSTIVVEYIQSKKVAMFF